MSYYSIGCRPSVAEQFGAGYSRLPISTINPHGVTEHRRSIQPSSQPQQWSRRSHEQLPAYLTNNSDNFLSSRHALSNRTTYYSPDVISSFDQKVLPLVAVVTRANRYLISYVADLPQSPHDHRTLHNALADKLMQVAHSELKHTNGSPANLTSQEMVNLLSKRAKEFLATQEGRFRQNLSLITCNTMTRHLAPRETRSVSTRTAEPLANNTHRRTISPSSREQRTDTQRRATSPSSREQATGTQRRATLSSGREQAIDQEMAYWSCNSTTPTASARWWQCSTDESQPGVWALAKLLYKLREHHQRFPQENLKQRVSVVLQALEKNSELRDIALAAACEGSSSCVDRSLYIFNQIEAQYEIHQVLLDKTTHPDPDIAMLRKLQGMIRQEKLNHLVDTIIHNRRAAANSIDDVDDIEVHLAYTIGLRGCLDLPGKTATMTFRRLAAVSDEDLLAAADKLLAAEQHEPQALIDAIERHPYWKLYLKTQHQSAHDADEEMVTFYKKQEELDQHDTTKRAHIQYNYKNNYIDAEIRDCQLNMQDINYRTQSNQLLQTREKQSADWYQRKSRELIAAWLAH